jgi:uncharacterized NAD(P)/FAD-binding protein YdhS
MNKTGIIGGGFSGTMTAVHVIKNVTEPVEITIINEQETFNKGIAFNPYSKGLLLNVSAAKMSAFSSHPDHFLDWVMNQKGFGNKDKNIVANSFLPRYLYGQYLSEIWNETISKMDSSKVKINVIDDFVIDLDIKEEKIYLTLSNGDRITLDKCLIASGNNLPGNPKIMNPAFYGSKRYFQNPWNINCVKDADQAQPILIIGNGLTMVDTVLGLLEQGFENKIYSISPNGFNILPHRHSGTKYSNFIDELSDTATLYDITKLFNKHIKLIREFGLSAEPIIDSLRPYTQKIWQRLTTAEKRLFMSRLRHLWGVARHRIPLHIHDKIQQLRIDDKLTIIAGKLIDIREKENTVNVKFYNKKHHRNEELNVSRIINCTGPETNLEILKDGFLRNCLINGIVSQDELKLGINADINTFQLIDGNGKKHSNLFTIGSNLRGILWESTAVNELRTQAEQIAKSLL